MILGIILTSIGSLLLIIACSELTESAMEQTTMEMTDNATISKNDEINSIPPIDAVAPDKTETATFALG